MTPGGYGLRDWAARCATFLIAACMLAATASAQLYSNVIQNGGFESGTSDTVFPPWTPYNNAFRYTTPLAMSGSYAVATWGNWWPEGQWNSSGVFQDYPTTPGEIWEAGVWALITADLQGQAHGTLNIELYDADTQMIHRATSANRIDASSPTNEWIRLTCKVRAIAGSTFVRVIPAFVQSPAFESGAVWFDNCALYRVATSTVEFAGREWIVADGHAFPGPNQYSTNCVRVDENGWLHMKLMESNGTWFCPSLEGIEHLGFGEYRWYVGSRVDLLASNLVAGLFTYAPEPVYGTNQNEIDIEFSRAFPGVETSNLLYTIQPYNIPGNGTQYPMDLTNDLTTHRFFWRPDRVDYQSYYGHTTAPDTNALMAAWRFEGRGIPIETDEVAHMNLWLLEGGAPDNTDQVEMIIHDFAFTPFSGFLLADEFDDEARSNCWLEAPGPGAVLETNERLVVTPASHTSVTGYATTEFIHRNERGEWYIFSATLSSVAVTQARSGEDVRAVLSLSAGTNSARQAAAAATLAGRYDEAADTLTVAFYTKTNSPNADGTLLFEGLLTNATGLTQSGGIEMRMELGCEGYRVAARDGAGAAIALATNAGAAAGAHGLSEALCYGYMVVGAQNSDTDSAGAVYWDRAAVGLEGQEQSFSITGKALGHETISVSCPAFFGTRWSLYRATNLLDSFAPVVTNLPARTSSVIFTNDDPAPAAYYRVTID